MNMLSVVDGPRHAYSGEMVNHNRRIWVAAAHAVHVAEIGRVHQAAKWLPCRRRFSPDLSQHEKQAQTVRTSPPPPPHDHTNITKTKTYTNTYNN
jgi:hypothetical protein